jgi:hypothetical protein
MPKETITHPDSWNTTDPDGRVEVHTGLGLAVRWGSVSQGGLDVVPGDVMLAVAEYATITGEEFQAAKSWPPAPEREIFVGPLTREQLNKLIRVLRRARDQAFGKDE